MQVDPYHSCCLQNLTLYFDLIETKFRLYRNLVYTCAPTRIGVIPLAREIKANLQREVRGKKNATHLQKHSHWYTTRSKAKSDWHLVWDGWVGLDLDLGILAVHPTHTSIYEIIFFLIDFALLRTYRRFHMAQRSSYMEIIMMHSFPFNP